MLMIRMFSVFPGTPGIRQQIPRTTISIFTPASEASISLSMIFLSVREFSLHPTYASSPFLACAISSSIMASTLFCRHFGATRRCSLVVLQLHPLTKCLEYIGSFQPNLYDWLSSEKDLYTVWMFFHYNFRYRSV